MFASPLLTPSASPSMAPVAAAAAADGGGDGGGGVTIGGNGVFSPASRGSVKRKADVGASAASSASPNKRVAGGGVVPVAPQQQLWQLRQSDGDALWGAAALHMSRELAAAAASPVVATAAVATAPSSSPVAVQGAATSGGAGAAGADGNSGGDGAGASGGARAGAGVDGGGVVVVDAAAAGATQTQPPRAVSPVQVDAVSLLTSLGNVQREDLSPVNNVDVDVCTDEVDVAGVAGAGPVGGGTAPVAFSSLLRMNPNGTMTPSLHGTPNFSLLTPMFGASMPQFELPPLSRSSPHLMPRLSPVGSRPRGMSWYNELQQHSGVGGSMRRDRSNSLASMPFDMSMPPVTPSAWMMQQGDPLSFSLLGGNDIAGAASLLSASRPNTPRSSGGGGGSGGRARSNSIGGGRRFHGGSGGGASGPGILFGSGGMGSTGSSAAARLDDSDSDIGPPPSSSGGGHGGGGHGGGGHGGGKHGPVTSPLPQRSTRTPAGRGSKGGGAAAATTKPGACVCV
jgi:hypothetical protein